MKIPATLHPFAALGIAILAMSATAMTTAAPQMAMKAPQANHGAPATTIRAESAWVRAAPPGAMMLAGYMSLRNDGRLPMRFVSAQSDAFGMVELHKSLLVDGVSTMRPAGGQVIPAGGSLRLEPGGMHLMLMEPRHELKAGEQVRFRLHFADGRVLDVVAVVSADAPAR